ncbi:MAG: hypothetical protein L0Y50_09020 [Beijerinckiaceae bacterium]|nr:hypothetical protein [Beijerinckiaceae bacterium]MCI0736394.1 hypothetical protein [Beijerinckiaceae bacterium]
MTPGTDRARPIFTALERVQQKWRQVLRQDTRQNKDLEQDDDSKKSHLALASEQIEDAVTHLPPVRVRTVQAEVAAFLRETGGFGSSGFVPLTFPFRWLGLPIIRGFIMQAMGGDAFLPIHEAQSFVCERELRIDSDYILAGDMSRTEEPPRLTLRIFISSPGGELCAKMETVLRIVPIDLRSGP